MVDNRINVKCAEAGISKAKLATMMPDEINGVVMSFMSSGKVLPTRDGLTAMCETFGCKVDDIYPDLDSIDLLGVVCDQDEQEAVKEAAEKADETESTESAEETEGEGKRSGRRSHEGMARFHAWLRPKEKEELVQMVGLLGYRNSAEWLRDMYRQTKQRCIALCLKEAGTQGDDSRDT